VSDKHVPKNIRYDLTENYLQLESMLRKLKQGKIYITTIGRVSVGKSSLLNALLGHKHFTTSPLHGETKSIAMETWPTFNADSVQLIDTPGINEVEGEDREKLAYDAATRSDVVLFVVDGDFTYIEKQALRLIAQHQRPVIIVFNKSDRYPPAEQTQIKQSLQTHIQDFIDPRNIIMACSKTREQKTILLDDKGVEKKGIRIIEPDIYALKERLTAILNAEGHTLAALNASLFAGVLTDQVCEKILDTRQDHADKIVKNYSLTKGSAVAVNPVPITDLIAAALLDGTMVIHLSRVYGLALNKSEARALVKAIGSQMLALIGTVWAVNIASSMLKISSAGASTVVTAVGQGAIAYYCTFVVGQAAKVYLIQGKSWGEKGPKTVVKEILDGLDRESIMHNAKKDIALYLKYEDAADGESLMSKIKTRFGIKKVKPVIKPRNLSENSERSEGKPF